MSTPPVVCVLTNHTPHLHSLHPWIVSSQTTLRIFTRSTRGLCPHKPHSASSLYIRGLCPHKPHSDLHSPIALHPWFVSSQTTLRIFTRSTHGLCPHKPHSASSLAPPVVCVLTNHTPHLHSPIAFHPWFVSSQTTLPIFTRQ
jgi:hypothetical protein